MDRENITDIFFDLDHTLWDFETNSANTFAEILQNHKIEVDLEQFLKHYIPINFAYWKLYREQQIEKEPLRYGRLKDSFDALEINIDDQTIFSLSDAYIEVLPTYNNLFPGTIEVLKNLQNNYKLHIITNGFEEIQETKLKRSGIHSYFDCIINSEMAGVKKPNPIIFELALDKAGVLAKNALMVGDNLEADIGGALGVGMQVIHFNSNEEPEDKNIPTIYHLDEINRFL
ncbi:MAG: YjjG family noncanonical pyrimidine nucleotidase [Flavobacteriaceae bacterium]|nr:YjjG family noncanonical pyrimidine nucleotidase [Flavobacteriaceae bacterium]